MASHHQQTPFIIAGTDYSSPAYSPVFVKQLREEAIRRNDEGYLTADAIVRENREFVRQEAFRSYILHKRIGLACLALSAFVVVYFVAEFLR